MVQLFTDSPSSRTVQAPHEVVSQPTLVPVRPSASRRWKTSSVRGSTSLSNDVPLTVIDTRIGTTPRRFKRAHHASDRRRRHTPSVAADTVPKGRRLYAESGAGT